MEGLGFRNVGEEGVKRYCGWFQALLWMVSGSTVDGFRLYCGWFQALLWMVSGSNPRRSRVRTRRSWRDGGKKVEERKGGNSE